MNRHRPRDPLTEIAGLATFATMERVMFTAQFWDERYRSADRLWSGRANQRLIEEIAGLHPGRALDVGCGEGADAIWLARQGWTVTGADVSSVALRRAADHAARSGGEVAARITWQQADLFADEATSLGAFDLVSSLYLHMPPEARDRAIERMTAAVAPARDLRVGCQRNRRGCSTDEHRETDQRKEQPVATLHP